MYSTGALAFGSSSHTAPIYGLVAQWTEHLPSKQEVEGSTPSKPNMRIAKLEFNLETQKPYFDLASNSIELALFIKEVRNMLRENARYSMNQNTTYSEIYEMFCKLYAESDIYNIVENLP